MNTVLIIPTGVGAEIGGHAGDGNPVAKLLAAVSDTLITHPNVLNASDINEMTENTLYVEGSMLDRFLAGEIILKRVKQNKILVAVNAPVDNNTINGVSAARATLGADIEIVELSTPLVMTASMKDDHASGTLEGADELIEQVKDYEFDALAVITKITVQKEDAFYYFTKGGTNPWGGVEAVLSNKVSRALDKPVAHAPFGDTLTHFNEVVDPRMAAELVSVCYMHCVLKGLHRAPRVSNNIKGLIAGDVDCLVSPTGLFGCPHRECMKLGIPIIFVTSNKTCHNLNYNYDNTIRVENYLEAAGVIASMRAGVDWKSVLRPLAPTIVRKANAR